MSATDPHTDLMNTKPRTPKHEPKPAGLWSRACIVCGKPVITDATRGIGKYQHAEPAKAK